MTRFFRFCLKCGEKFWPVGRFTQCCDNCQTPQSRGKKLKNKERVKLVLQQIQ